MPDVYIPETAVRREVRADGFICRNNLDSTDPVMKYTAQIDRIAEPQDVNGDIVAPRIRLPSITLDLPSLMGQSFTAAGITATGAQILSLINAVIDEHKGDGL